MKTRRILILISLTMLASAFVSTSLNNERSHDESHLYPAPVDSKKLDINNISTWFTNIGSFNREPVTGNQGFEWPKGTNHFARYVSGIWMAARVDGDTLLCLADFDEEFLPGYIDETGTPQGLNDPAYRIYSIIRGDTLSPDYLNWPANQGAYLNEMGKPFFLGTQTMFYSYTDGYPQAHSNNLGSTAPLKAVILQTNWAYTNIGLQDVCFSEYKIVNRSNHLWEDCYIAIWTDDDLGDAWDDAIGIDSLRNLGINYNFDNYDPQYGTNPPAVGFKVLRAPMMASSQDTARYFDPPGSLNLKIKPGFKESGLYAFNVFYNSDPVTGDPGNYRQTYMSLQGLRRNRTPWVNPVTGQVTRFAYTGDPVTGLGWNPTSSGAQRFIMVFGSLDILPNDTQSVIIAQVIARGSSNLNSITKLRELSDHVQSIYDNNFQSVLSSGNNSSSVPNEFSLHQNYPNPFNPSTTIEYDLPTSGEVVIIIYDVSGREVRRIDAGVKPPGIHKLELNADGLSSGAYLCKAVFSSNSMSTVKSMRLMLIR